VAGRLPSGTVVAQHGAAALKAEQTYGTFIALVSDSTGIPRDVLATWAAAEGGPVDNPLNLRPGAHYGSQKGAATATIQVLQGNHAYAGILSASQQGDVAAILDAIAHSPWDAGHYTQGDGTVGSFLRKLYGEAFGPTTSTLHIGVPDPFGVGKAVGAVVGFIGALLNPHTWYRAGLVLGGGLLIVLGIVRLASSGATPV
jgi:hypothetical protein